MFKAFEIMSKTKLNNLYYNLLKITYIHKTQTSYLQAIFYYLTDILEVGIV